MPVSKEGIERIKSANELSAVVAEHGIELKNAHGGSTRRGDERQGAA